MTQKKKKSVTVEALGVIRLSAAGYQQARDAARAKKWFSAELLEGIQLTPPFRASDTDFVYPASRNKKGNFSIDIVFKFVINCYRSHRK